MQSKKRKHHQSFDFFSCLSYEIFSHPSDTTLQGIYWGMRDLDLDEEIVTPGKL